MGTDTPSAIVIAGPNGAGKSTLAPVLVHDALGGVPYVNADVIAAHLSPDDPDAAALTAARTMLLRLRALAAERSDFAFETTLATRSFARWLERLRGEGYAVHLIFLWLRHPDLAVARVAHRVRLGGHDIPLEVIRRRYDRGLANFFSLYQRLTTTWRFYDNSLAAPPRLLARGSGLETAIVTDRATWRRIQGDGTA
ncbi:MAG: zeta toxin family protein [Planctomycetota bacterium]